MHNENMEEIKSISMQNVTFSYKGKKRYVFEGSYAFEAVPFALLQYDNGAGKA